MLSASKIDIHIMMTGTVNRVDQNVIVEDTPTPIPELWENAIHAAADGWAPMIKHWRDVLGGNLRHADQRPAKMGPIIALKTIDVIN